MCPAPVHVDQGGLHTLAGTDLKKPVELFGWSVELSTAGAMPVCNCYLAIQYQVGRTKDQGLRGKQTTRNTLSSGGSRLLCILAVWHTPSSHRVLTNLRHGLSWCALTCTSRSTLRPSYSCGSSCQPLEQLPTSPPWCSVRGACSCRMGCWSCFVMLFLDACQWQCCLKAPQGCLHGLGSFHFNPAGNQA